MNEKGGRSRPFPLAEAGCQTPGNFLAYVRRDVLHAHIGCG
jgi:hypothetical protein